MNSYPCFNGGLFENSVLPASNEAVQFWGTPALDKPLKRLTISPPTKLGFPTNEPPKTGLWDGTTSNFSKIMMMCHECHCIPTLRPAFSSNFFMVKSWFSHHIFLNSPAFPRHFPNIFPQVGRHSCAVDFLRASGFLEADDAEAEAEELSG